MQLEEVIQYLIGIGASTGAGCEPCLQTCIAMARHLGADEQNIATAAAIGSKVRRCAEGHCTGGTSNGKGTAACCGSTDNH